MFIRLFLLLSIIACSAVSIFVYDLYKAAQIKDETSRLFQLKLENDRQQLEERKRIAKRMREEFRLSKIHSLLVLDMDGKGFKLEPLNSSNTLFDSNSNGISTKISWVSPQYAFLVLDKEKDSKIINSGEMFNLDGSNGANNIYDFDTNNDNKLTDQDTSWHDLQLWIDKDKNGVSNLTELMSLSLHGISSIDLKFTGEHTKSVENTVGASSYYTQAIGSKKIANIMFATDPQISTFRDIGSINVECMWFLDTLDFYVGGRIPALRIKMCMDDAFREHVKVLTEKAYDVGYFENKDIENLMYKWADIEDVSPTSRGTYIDARKIEFIEESAAQEFISDYGVYNENGKINPVRGATKVLDKLFVKVRDQLAFRLAAKTIYADVFDIHELINFNREFSSVHTNLSPEIVWGDYTDDVLTGSLEDELILGNKGNDTLNGAAGNDWYIFSKGVGHDVYLDTLGKNTLYFDVTVSPEDVEFQYDGVDVIIVNKSTNDSVKISNFNGESNQSIFEKVIFDNANPNKMFTVSYDEFKNKVASPTASKGIAKGWHTVQFETLEKQREKRKEEARMARELEIENQEKDRLKGILDSFSETLDNAIVKYSKGENLDDTLGLILVASAEVVTVKKLLDMPFASDMDLFNQYALDAQNKLNNLANLNKAQKHLQSMLPTLKDKIILSAAELRKQIETAKKSRSQKSEKDIAKEAEEKRIKDKRKEVRHLTSQLKHRYKAFEDRNKFYKKHPERDDNGELDRNLKHLFVYINLLEGSIATLDKDSPHYEESKTLIGNVKKGLITEYNVDLKNVNRPINPNQDVQAILDKIKKDQKEASLEYLKNMIKEREGSLATYKVKYEENPKNLWNARTYIGSLLDLRNLYKTVNDDMRYKATDSEFQKSLSLFSRETEIQKSQLRVELYRDYLSFIKKMKQGL